MPIKSTTQKTLTETQQIANNCIEIAMGRCRSLNEQAVMQIRSGHYKEASYLEMKADQCEWIANAIRRKFGIKES